VILPVNNGNRKRFDVPVKALIMLDAHSTRIMKRTSECRINERVWKRHNAYGRKHEKDKMMEDSNTHGSEAS
jgi:hypothetical protein